MLAILLVCSLAAVNAINTQDIRRYMDVSFAHYDHSPLDGLVEENEWDATIYREDLNNDTCVTLQEYLAVHTCPQAAALYHHYDHNSDSCLKVADMSQEFHLIDHSGDNVVSLHEWELYFQHLTQKLFGHLIHGPGSGR
ncbi:uncharacterized protein LOC127835285 [Dreissena polymorpha]|uniref:EF-hand domain-containing protein n=1 Tax=Dreissena polymorpha TaxID=45954 RepID=A0A9D4FW86_DREPO|nr:uncharacterized protein LOC127835211 [Dreissena polymorpha]XP_052217494.1 uncharacterized protein LOC127835211 [Dreissena polymorpha]XP_052217593.1 uncharacterized protein LOC127835285 [Dreissena polymorpha]XP_052217594.1 uncharacterized protein LOC127835285 [Dreissena polymorpha]KAH3805938.1 hypothetical protein DPMN_134248 [Dreissena polymorpha]KAH3806138.1 hypothetical protein DPMN_134453 [Dreissena polymorpha]